MRKTFIKSVVVFILFFAACATAFSENDFLQKTTEKIEKSMTAKGKYGDAVKKLNALIENYPDNARLYMDLGIANYGLMKYQKAYECFKKAEGIGPDRDFGDVLKYMITAMDENRTSLSEVERTNDALQSGSSDEKNLKTILTAGHYMILNNLLSKRYYYPSGVTAHVIWLKDNVPGFTGIHHVAGDIYYLAMYYREAEIEYKKAIEKDPENPRLPQALANCLVATGNFDAAQKYYDKAIELYGKSGEPDDKAIIARLTNIRRALPKKYKDIDELIKKKDYDGAEVLCKKRLLLNPSDYVAITQLGEIYWRKQDRRKAIKLFRKAAKMVPDYPNVHLLLGRAYFFEKKPEKGMERFRIFKEKMRLLPQLDEDTIDYYVLSLHYISYIYITQKEYGKALKEFQEIIELDPDDQEAHYNLGYCYYKHYRNRSRAYGELKKAIELDPSSYLAGRAEFLIDFIRRNPDPRIIEDYNFIYEKE